MIVAITCCRFHRKVVFLTEATIPIPCQIRSKTESPCLRRAVVEMRGVAFCGPCAREQEAYFAIGELTQDETQGLLRKPLAKALERMRRERVGGKGDITIGRYH